MSDAKDQAELEADDPKEGLTEDQVEQPTEDQADSTTVPADPGPETNPLTIVNTHADLSLIFYLQLKYNKYWQYITVFKN